MIGSQFHPEDNYFDEDCHGINRNKQFLDNIFGLFEGYHRSMQYANQNKIPRKEAIAAMRKVNADLIAHLKSCVN